MSAFITQKQKEDTLALLKKRVISLSLDVMQKNKDIVFLNQKISELLMENELLKQQHQPQEN